MSADTTSLRVDDRSADAARGRPGALFVMTGASGVGKDTIRQAALPNIDVHFSVSATTRGRRPGEVDARHPRLLGGERIL